MYQKIIAAGNLGGDPEMRYMNDGTPVTNFSMATSRRWTDRASGEKREETTWLRVSAWGNQAETANQYLSKGKKVLVEGRLRPDDRGGPRTFTGQDGVVRASFEVTADSIRFLSGRDEEAGYLPAGGNQNGAVPEEDEIPF